MTIFSELVIAVVKSIPPGKVLSYGAVARRAGTPCASRQVARILHSCSKRHNLPWHRVLNSQGKISLPAGNGFELQKALLEQEEVIFGPMGRISLKLYLWTGEAE